MIMINLEPLDPFYQNLAKIICDPKSNTRDLGKIIRDFQLKYREDKEISSYILIESQIVRYFPLNMSGSSIIETAFSTPEGVQVAKEYIQKRLNMEMCKPYRALFLINSFYLYDDGVAGNQALLLMFEYWKELIQDLSDESDKRVSRLYSWIIQTAKNLKNKNILNECSALLVPVLQNWSDKEKYGYINRVCFDLFLYTYSLPEDLLNQVLMLVTNYFKNISDYGPLNNAIRVIEEGRFFDFINFRILPDFLIM